MIPKWIEKNIDKVVWGIIISLLLLLQVMVYIESKFLPIDLRWNLFAELIGATITVILLNFLLGWKEQYKWRLVRGIVHTVLRREINLIYTDSSMFLEGLTGLFISGKSPQELEENKKKEFYKKLKERAESTELRLFEKALEIGKKHNFDEIFEHRRTNLNDIELKYSKFLEPPIIHAIVLIEDGLYSAALQIQLLKRNKISDDQFLLRIEQIIHQVIKEIYKLHIESKIEIYFD